MPKRTAFGIPPSQEQPVCTVRSDILLVIFIFSEELILALEEQIESDISAPASCNHSGKIRNRRKRRKFIQNVVHTIGDFSHRYGIVLFRILGSENQILIALLDKQRYQPVVGCLLIGCDQKNRCRRCSHLIQVNIITREHLQQIWLDLESL